MTEKDYQKILKNEKIKLTFSAGVLPSIIFFILIYLMISFEDSGFFALVAMMISELGIMYGYLSIEYSEAFSLRYIRKQRKLSKKYPKRSAIIHFESIGFERLVIRHMLQEKVFRFYVIVTVILTVIILSSFFIFGSENLFYLFGFWALPGMMVYIMSIPRWFMLNGADFGFCFARGCFKIINNFRQLEDIVQTNYFILGLTNYDNYLKRNLKVRIKNLEKIYSQIVSDDLETQNKSIETIHNLLEEGRKLDLLRYLAKFLGEKNKQEILEPEKFSKKFKDSFPIVITVITTGIIVIEFLRQFYS